MPLRRPARPLHLRPPLGRRLAELRLAAGRTQADVAHALGVAPSFVARVEVGEKLLPAARRAAWAALLGADLAELEALR
jgi:transcriptional regulator with XRE-family HTH domain